MMTYQVQGFAGGSDLLIQGNDLADAVERNFDAICKHCTGGIGNAAGAILDRVHLAYRDSILGGRGGIELTIDARGADLAHQPASPEIRRTIVWIHGSLADCPEPRVIDSEIE